MSNEAKVYLVDDDDDFRDSLETLCRSVDLDIEGFASARDFLDSGPWGGPACLVLDIRMPGMSGLELQRELIERGVELPILFITGHGDVPVAVTAMKAGAVDFLTKPFSHQALLDRIQATLRSQRVEHDTRRELDDLRARRESLTARELEVMELVVEGLPNKVIASRLDISQRTVEIHRAQGMTKMGADSLAQLVRQAVRLEQG